jgi:uncharacterized damage-inducible protein DinB
MRSTIFVAGIVLLASIASAQTPDPNPYTTTVRRQFRGISTIITRAAEKVPEEHYAFKPTPEVRCFAEVVGHLVDANWLLCRAAHENKFEIKQDHEKKPGSKADLIAAFRKSVEYCETAFEAMTDANGTTGVKLGGERLTPKLMVLASNNSHAWEHYGNLVTYMRLKGIVPPTSEPRPASSK